MIVNQLSKLSKLSKGGQISTPSLVSLFTTPLIGGSKLSTNYLAYLVDLVN